MDEGFTNCRAEGKEQLGCDLYLSVIVLGDTGSKAIYNLLGVLQAAVF